MAVVKSEDHSPDDNKYKSLVFICRENRIRSGILLFAEHPRFCLYIGYSPEICLRFARNDTFICDRGT